MLSSFLSFHLQSISYCILGSIWFFYLNCVHCSCSSHSLSSRRSSVEFIFLSWIFVFENQERKWPDGKISKGRRALSRRAIEVGMREEGDGVLQNPRERTKKIWMWKGTCQENVRLMFQQGIAWRQSLELEVRAWPHLVSELPDRLSRLLF